MAVFEIDGGHRLSGEVSLSGAKNAALPILFGSLLSEGIVELEDVPTLMEDVKVSIDVIRHLGAGVEVEGTSVVIDPSGVGEAVLPMELVSKIRYSLLLLSVLLVKFGRVELPFPGGCDIGTRKFDLHIKGLRDLGARMEVGENGIVGEAESLKGNDIEFYLPTTSGTENILLGAVLARGRTTIRNANTRPEIKDFVRFLNSMGADIDMSSRFVEIRGVSVLNGTKHTVMKGRDEAMTFMIAAGMTGGDIVINDYNLDHLQSDARYLRESGVEIFEWGGSVYVSGKNGIKPFDMFTAPYPGVNSDMQPLFAALALMADGESTITDQRFMDRFEYVKELASFGGRINHYGNCAVVRGGSGLKGAEVRAVDIRGGASAVLAGLAADGTTVVDNIYQIDRGYERIEKKLAGLGAVISRKK